MLDSSLYYAQTNGQTESSNRTLISLIKKKICDHPNHLHKILSEALWAHRISKYCATKVSHPVLEGKPNTNHVRARIRNSRTQRLHK
jgi:hypothetical protein